MFKGLLDRNLDFSISHWLKHDYVTLFELVVHFFLCLTISIALYDEEYMVRSGPLTFQREYAARLSHWLGKDYPTVAL